MKEYLFKSRWKRLLVAGFDALGGCVFKRKPGLPPHAPAAYTVIRLDHIGDAVLTEPFLRGLKDARRASRVVLAASSAAREIYASHPDVDEIAAFDAEWFRPRPNFFRVWKDFFGLIKLLKTLPGEVIVDLRGDLRHILAARIARPRAWILGHGATGGGSTPPSAP